MQLGTIYTVLLTIYILSSLLVPLAVINKMVFLLLMVIYGIYVLFVKKEHQLEYLKVTKAPLVILAVFLYGFFRGMAGSADLALAKQFLFAAGVLLLIYPIREFNIDMNKILKYTAKIYILFFAVYVVYAINLMDFTLPQWLENTVSLLDNAAVRWIGSSLHELCSGTLTKRSFFEGSGMQIYLGTTPFLLILTDILFIDFLKDKKKCDLVFVGLSVLMTLTTGSRTLILLIPASLCVLVWAGLDKKKQIITAVGLAVLAMAAFLYLLKFSNFFSLSESSNFVKVGHISSYLEQLNLKNVLLGDGLASFYYSAGTTYEIAHTEITLMDHCRYFGIPLALVVWYLLIVPQNFGGWKEVRHWKIWCRKEELLVFLMYLVFAQTNPVLFNSFGLIAVLWYWNIYLMPGEDDPALSYREKG